jgi:hypothetical protein
MAILVYAICKCNKAIFLKHNPKKQNQNISKFSTITEAYDSHGEIYLKECTKYGYTQLN